MIPHQSRCFECSLTDTLIKSPQCNCCLAIHDACSPNVGNRCQIYSMQTHLVRSGALSNRSQFGSNYLHNIYMNNAPIPHKCTSLVNLGPLSQDHGVEDSSKQNDGVRQTCPGLQILLITSLPRLLRWRWLTRTTVLSGLCSAIAGHAKTPQSLRRHEFIWVKGNKKFGRVRMMYCKICRAEDWENPFGSRCIKRVLLIETRSTG